MPPLPCPTDDLFHNVCDLTSTTKIIGTKPFTYGGYSDIWRGVEWGAGATRDVVIKTIRVPTRQSVSLDRLKKRFSREIVIWNAVTHPNILPLYGLCWVDGSDRLPATVYPYCEAGNCVDYLNNNTDADQMAILRQVAAGLSHLHSCNPPITHGDIRAAKILIRQDGTPLISGFGLSRLAMELSTGLTTQSNKRSYRWMAPEFFGGISDIVEPVSTTAGDVWAFGCFCIEILLGALPWASTRSDAEIMLAVVKDRQTPPLPESTTTTVIGHIMRHCWVYEPADRPTMVQLVNALVEIDPEHLHTSACVLLQPTVSSNSPPALLNSNSDSFALGPLIPLNSQTVTRTKAPTAPLGPLISPHEESSHRRGSTASSTSTTPYLDMLSLEASSQSSLSGPMSRDELSTFRTPAPLFSHGPWRPSKSIRETQRDNQPLWPRAPSLSSPGLPQTSRLGSDDAFRSDAWRRSDAGVSSSTRPPPRSPSLHIWTPPRTDPQHGLHPSLIGPFPQYSSDRSTTATSKSGPVTPVDWVPPQSPPPRHDNAAPPLQSQLNWSPGMTVSRDFRIATSIPIRISTPDGKPATIAAGRNVSDSTRAGRRINTFPPALSSPTLPQTLPDANDALESKRLERSDIDTLTRTQTDYAKLTFSSASGASRGRYLTKGSAADVWVIDVEDNKYACKVLRVSTSNFDDEPVITGGNQNSQGTGEVTWSSFVKAYRSQISKWAKARHTNVIRIHDHDESLNLHVEYCHQGSVWDYLKVLPSGMAPKRHIICGILNGLSYLHSQSPPIIHGSLNTGKIFIDKNRGVKIGEFGLAALCYHAAPYCPSVTFTGFSRWMSPEMLDIDPDDNIMVPPTTESDVWALGCTIFEILAEELPYANYRHDIKIQRAILGGELPGPLTIDTEYRPTLESCWSKSPDKRPTATHLCALNNIKDDQGGPSAGSDSTGLDKDIDMEELFFSYGNPPTLESIARWVEDCKARREPIVCPLKDCKQILRRAHALKDHLLCKFNIKGFPCGHTGCTRAFATKTNCNRHMQICGFGGASGG